MNECKLDYHVNLLKSILWQYEDAPKLKTLVTGFNEVHNDINNDFWCSWYRDVFNIDTANNFGLEVWARILGVKSDIDKPAQDDKKAFGFGRKRSNYHKPTNFGSRDGGSVGFTLEQRRMLIRARAFQLVYPPTMDNINYFLKRYFWYGHAKAYIHDTQDMAHATYTFNYHPDGNLLTLIEQADLLPRPSTVKVKLVILSKKSWGVGKFRQNFASPSNFGDIE